MTNRTAGRLDARERGELIILKPGRHGSYDLELGALDGPEAIDALRSGSPRSAASCGPGKGDQRCAGELDGSRRRGSA